MNELLLLFIALPFFGFVISLLLPEKKEALISWLAFGTVFTQLVTLLISIIFWMFNGAKNLNLFEITLLKNEHYEFFIDFYFDKISAVYLFIGALLTSMITTYSRYYLHREKDISVFLTPFCFSFLAII